MERYSGQKQDCGSVKPMECHYYIYACWPHLGFSRARKATEKDCKE